MICGVCKLEIPLHMRKEHLSKYHKIDEHLVNWIIRTDDDLISLQPKINPFYELFAYFLVATFTVGIFLSFLNWRMQLPILSSPQKLKHLMRVNPQTKN
jgi:hypothetical protein